MYQKLSLVTIGILLFGVFITSALGSINGGWVSSLIKGGTNSGSLGFWSPDTPQASTPQMTLTQSGMEVNGGMRITGGNPSFGKILTALDGNGNATWEYPMTPINFVELAGFTSVLPNRFIEEAQYTGYSITFPDYGTYSLTMTAMFIMTGGTVINMDDRLPIIQFTPSIDPMSWRWGYPLRFAGSYEVYATPAQLGGPDYRFYLSENITLTPDTGKTAYLHIGGGAGMGGSIHIGKNGVSSCPQCTGGSYTRIK